MTIAALTSLISGVEWPTRQALFPHLIERPGLMSAVALNSVLWQSTRMIMPALGGVLIAATSTAFLFALSGVGFVVMFFVMLAIPIALPGTRGGSTLHQIQQGLGFIAAHELFRWLILLSYAGMFFVSSYMQLMPAFALHLEASETGYGFLLSATGVGSVVGTLAVGGMQNSRSLGFVLLAGALLSSVSLYGFAVAVQYGWYGFALFTAFASSVCASVFMICSMSVMQLEVPDALRGRVMGVHSITYSLMPLGGLLLGAIAHETTLVAAVAFGASAFLIVTLLVGVTRPAIREIDGKVLAHALNGFNALQETAMKIGVFATFMSPQCTPQFIVDFGRRAEAAGLDSIWMGEHVVLFDRTEFPYPGSRDGKLPVPEGGGMLDTVATFGFLASVTKTIRFGTGIALISQRNPIYTAKEFTTLDWLSGGRIDFGIGVGWCKEEVLASGYRLGRPRRAQRRVPGAGHAAVDATGRELFTASTSSSPTAGSIRSRCRNRTRRFSSAATAPRRCVARRATDRVGTALRSARSRPRRCCSGSTRRSPPKAGRADGFEIVITPPYRVSDDMLRGFADLGVDRVVPQLGSQKPEAVTDKLKELERFVRVAA